MPDQPTTEQVHPSPELPPASERRSRTGRQRLWRVLRTPVAGQVVVGVAARRGGLRGGDPGARQRAGQHLRGLPRAGPHRRAHRTLGRRPARRGRAGPARERPPRPALGHQPARGRAGRGQAVPATPTTSWRGWCRSPGRASGSPSPRPRARSRSATMIDTVQELRNAGRRGDRRSTARSGSSPRRRSRTASAASGGRRAGDVAVRDRRDRRARPRCAAGWSSFAGRVDQLEEDGAEVDIDGVQLARHHRGAHAGAPRVRRNPTE